MSEIIDLSYSFHEGMLKYPSDPEVGITVKRAEIVPDKGDIGIWDESGSLMGCSSANYKSGYTELRIRNHHGTHVDAPAHKIPGGKKISDYGIGKFVNPAFVLDLSHAGILEREGREITLDDVRDASRRHPVQGIAAAVIYTGYSDEMMKCSGLRGELRTELEADFPHLSEDAARFFVDRYRALNILGIDSFSVDRRGSNSEAHRILFAADVLPLETLVNLSELVKRADGSGFLLYSVPLNYDFDAAQTRAYAVLGGENGNI